MKTRAFKKAISVVCVLSMLLSLCVVSFVGTASADESTGVVDVLNGGTPQNYTLYNNGTSEVKNAVSGDALPTIANSNFLGWYDTSLTTKYTTYPADVTTLVAKYDGVTVDFDSGVFKPNTNNNLYMDIVDDPEDATNKVAAIRPKDGGNNMHIAPLGAVGATDGLKLTNGKVYEISFKYYAKNVGSKSVDLSIRASAYANVGTSGGKTGGTGSFIISEDTNGWANGSFTFTFNGTEASPYLIFLAQQYINPQTATVYFDDIVIKPYVPVVVTEDFEMDFEDVDNAGFKWSVNAANNYTYSSGNGYVTRGEILANEDDTNKFFKLMHFKKKNGNHYFTVNNGEHQLALAHGGIYTVEFDYFVEHSETPAKLNLYYVSTKSGTVKGLATLDEFNYRDDDATLGWSHATYTFIANSDSAEYSSLGIGLFNSTNCPEEYATAVLFDNVVVKTHSIAGSDAIVIFDSKGGDECESMVVEVGGSPVALPAPNRYGYDFAGWKYDVTTGEGEEAVTETFDLTTSTVIPEGIMNAYATWTLKDGVIELGFRTNVEEYDANVGTIVAFPGQPVLNMPADPECNNQTFVGWYLDRNFKKALDVNSAPSKSTVLFAKWDTEGVVIDYEDYTITDVGRKSDRYKIITEENGNKVLSHCLKYGTIQSADAIARAMFQTEGKIIRAYEGAPYVVTFKYKVEDFKSQGKFYVFLSSATNTWGNYKQQTGSVAYTSNTDGWAVGKIEFNATLASDATSADNYMSIGCSGNATLFIDDVVISCPENDMNIYGSAIRFNVNGGKTQSAISGDLGDEIKLPTPVKPGYKFVGWYTDNTLETKFTEKYFGEEPILLHAKWQLGKFEESFEDYPASIQQLGIAPGNSLYSSTAVGFDSSNIHSGKFSLFRNGATAGVKSFTLMRAGDLAIDVGETYTLTLWVKPTAISSTAGSISLMSMSTFTGVNAATESGTIASYSDLKEGEWQQLTYTFVATTPFVAIGTAAGCDMYIDDISITLKGYTGSASTGDNSVSPIIILAFIIVSAGALLITGKKVFSK